MQVSVEHENLSLSVPVADSREVLQAYQYLVPGVLCVLLWRRSAARVV